MKLKYRMIMLFLAGLCSLAGCKGLSGSSGEENMSSQGEEATEADTLEGGLLSEEELQVLYEEYVADKAAETRYKHGKWGYYDVDQDGTDELILVAESGQLCIVQNQYGELEILYEDNHSILLENGMIRYYEFGGGQQYEQYVFYALTNGRYQAEASMSRYDTIEDKYRRFNEDDRYEIDRGAGAMDVSMDEWADGLKLYMEYPDAEITLQSMGTEDGKLLTYATETEAYQAFLKGECGAVLSDSYTDDSSHVALCLREGEVYTLYDILNLINNEPWRYESGDNWILKDGAGVTYAYVDCGQDGRKELALKIEQRTIDNFELIYVLQYRDNQLYLCYGIDRWSRSHVLLNQYGYIWRDGSGGVALHGGADVLIDGEGVSHRVWDWIKVFCYPYYFSMAGDYPMCDLLNETAKAWMEDHDTDIRPLEGLAIQMSVIDDQDYYTYEYYENVANVKNVESFIESCEAAGVVFSSDVELATALRAKKETLHAVELTEDRNEVEWTRFIFTANE